ncbi:MAG: ABC transporter ATP-binding protein [Bacilli bacterium]|nr:ABC transporter ATP-binding protein [Bacilli bacterium]
MKNTKSKEDYFVEVSHLKKSYGILKAVDDISFTVKKGALFAFLGVNGAGKSTTINIISSTLEKDSGIVKVGGYDLVKDNAKVKERIGIVFQNSVLDSLLTVRENLTIRARFYRLKKDALKDSIERVSKILNLYPILDQEVGKLSGGQKRRVDIARALIHEPKLLMLDEPTTGLDPKTRLDVWKLIDEVRERTNMTVFLTTHYLEEADKASYVVIMNKGKIIAEGTPNELKNRYSTDTLIAYQKQNDVFEKNIKGYKFVYDHDARAYRIRIKDSSDAKKLLEKYNKYIPDFEVEKGDMNSVFLNVVGGKK